MKHVCEWLVEALDDILRENYEERAGIKQFCALMPREQAEQEAYAEEVDGKVSE